VRLGRITPRTQLAYLESLHERLGGYQGPEWTATAVTLAHTRPATAEQPEVLEVFDSVQLRAADEAAAPLVPPRRLRAV
jgi:hypothetical protein